MNAIEIADWISEYLEDIAHEPWGNNQIMMDEAQTMLRQLQVERDKLFLAHSHEMARADIAQMQIDKYKQVLESIANERIELSHDKIKWQCGDHIRWAKDVLKQSEFTDNNIVNSEPVAIRYDFDGYGYQYMDSGSGSDWQTRVEGELLYTRPADTQVNKLREQADQIAELKNARDYWCLQYKDVINKLETRCNGK